MSKLHIFYLFHVKKLDGLRELSKETISLIKIDIEGHEINALNGGKKLILKSRPNNII